MDEPMTSQEEIDESLSRLHGVMIRAFELVKKFHIGPWVALRAVRDVAKLRKQVGADND